MSTFRRVLRAAVRRLLGLTCMWTVRRNLYEGYATSGWSANFLCISSMRLRTFSSIPT